MIRSRMERASQTKQERFAKYRVHLNAPMGPRQLQLFCRTDTAGQELLRQVTDRLGLSARTCTLLLKVARTIADLDDSREITVNPLAEALQYRSVDHRAFRNQPDCLDRVAVFLLVMP